ncbi:MAG TPA: hypothetical protein VFR17_00845 [Mycobacterium sp.]|nr:hypothetical protein [Mycobacterium sp.]
MIAGALAMMLTGSVLAAMPAVSTTAAALALRTVFTSGSSNPFQPEIDQLLDAQQQIVEHNSTLPYIVPSDLPMLGQYAQNLALTILATQLHTLSGDKSPAISFAPYPWSANGANPQGFLTYANPDDQYGQVHIEPNQTYVVTVDPGPGTQDVTFTPNSGNGGATNFGTLPGGIDLAHATPNADGSYTVVLSATAQPGNWVDTAGAQTVLVRDTLGDWGLPHDSFSIVEKGSATANILPLLSDSQIASALSGVATNMPTQNAAGSYLGQVQAFDTIANNTFTPIRNTIETAGGHISAPLTPGQLGSLGHYSLQPDQALIVKVPDIDSAYTGLMLTNDWGQPVPFATVSGSLNNTQIFHDPDGFTYYVISSQDPGVANWADDSGIDNGGVFLRWQNVTGSAPSTPVQAEVVNVADVCNDLPSDTPLVTAADRAAEFKERLFDYDYAQDQNHNITWVGANLLYDQFRNAMGAQQFVEVFGGQQDVPSIADRLTPTLSPDMTAVGHDLLTNPASLTALMDNLPLAFKDIEFDAILAAARLAGVVEQTAQAVHSDIASGDLTRALAALSSGVQGLQTVFSETSTDPATSISAGFLNARDDLAVAVMNAGSSTSPVASEWASLSELNQELLDTLLHTGGS